MARTITSLERSYVGNLRSGHWARLEIWDSTSTFLDYSVNVRNIDWLNALSLEENIDQNCMTLNGNLLRSSGALSLAPFMASSLLNQVGGSYATLLDLWRKWRVSLAVTREDYPPTGSDWKAMGEGRIDRISVGEQITISGRSEEAVLLQKWIPTERQYGSVGGINMETVIQSMLDDNLGAGVVTLYCPVSPVYTMNTWTQQKGNLMGAIQDVAAKAGFKVRYRYDAGNVYRLTLYKPNRTATVEDWSLGPSEYTSVLSNDIGLDGIRNYIKERFAHPTLGTQTVISPWQAGTGTVSCAAGVATFSTSQAGILKVNSEIIVAGIAYTLSTFNGTTGGTLLSQLSSGGVPTFSASAFTASDTVSGAGTTVSIARFGRVDLELDLSFQTQVNDATKAQPMTDAIRSDTEFPNLEHSYETLGAWFIQLHDYGKFEANNVHYDSPQWAGITSIRHEMSNGTIKTTLAGKGKPAGAYTGWRFIPGVVTPAVTPQLTFAEAIARITGTTATTVTVTVTANPASPPQQVQFVGVTGGATLNSGTAAGVWVTPNGTNNVWVFNRAAINAGVGQAQFRAGNTSAFPNDDDLVSIEEQGRDTIALTSRARVTATTATTLTVRVAVADPFPQGAASGTIGYSELGLGGATSPATGQTVTPAATLAEAAGTFVDYTVTRPAFGVGAGRITFTVTAANRTSDSDAVDVPEINRDTVYLATRARVLSVTATTVVVRVAVADPYPQGSNSVSLAYVELNTGAATSPTSPQLLTPAATLTEAAGTYADFTITRPAFGAGAGRVTFTATASGRVTDSDAVDVEEVGRDTVYLTSRARVTSTTATTVVVRYAVADPYPQGAASVTITYQDLGSGGVSPSSGGTVTPAATLTEAAGTYIDYTVTRPAFGAGAGRVTFTASAANRTTDSDAVDVPEVDRDTVALGMRARVTATTATTLTVRVAVADPYPQGAASVSIATQDLGVGSATTPSSPQTVTPVSTITEAAGTFVDYTVTRPAYGTGAGRVTWTATATGRTSTFDAVDVPEQGSANLGSSRLRCGLKRSGSLSVTQNADIAVGFDTEDFDVGGLHDTATNNSHITIPTGGGGVPWLFAMLASWGNNTDTTQRKVSLWKNNVLLADGVAVAAINGNTTQQTFTWMDVPADGDYYEMYVRHTAAAAINLDINSRFRGVSLW